MSAEKFDPQPHIIQIRQRGGGMADYLPVAARLAWFRSDHPDGTVETRLLSYDGQEAVFVATIGVPGGGTATGHGSETRQDFPSGPLEKAESKSLGRALAALGYGTLQAGDELDEGDRIADTPAKPKAPQERRSTPPPAPGQAARTNRVSAQSAPDPTPTQRAARASAPQSTPIPPQTSPQSADQPARVAPAPAAGPPSQQTAEELAGAIAEAIAAARNLAQLARIRARLQERAEAGDLSREQADSLARSLAERQSGMAALAGRPQAAAD